MNVWNEIKMTFKHGSIITQLIYVNLAVFLVIRVIYVFFYMFNVDFDLLKWLALPSSLRELAYRPWTLFTYMFLHFNFLHILFNLLWLHWFGNIFLTYFDEKKLLGTYIMGGLLGGIAYVLAYNFIPAFTATSSILLGASASIIAIVVASALYAPNLQINILLISSLFGPIKIIWIALISVALYFIGISGSNAGGNIAHLGGALWGFVYMWQLKRGRDIIAPFNRFLSSFGSLFRRRKLKVTYRNNVGSMSDWEYNARRKKEKEAMNEILDKIGKSGYESLTKREKEILFHASSKNRNSKDQN